MGEIILGSWRYKKLGKHVFRFFGKFPQKRGILEILMKKKFSIKNNSSVKTGKTAQAILLIYMYKKYRRTYHIW